MGVTQLQQPYYLNQVSITPIQGEEGTDLLLIRKNRPWNSYIL